MSYLDTTRLAHIKDKADWPKNWARDSEPADFMAEVLDGPTQDLKRTYRVSKRLEDSVAACVKQYGALLSTWREWCLWEKNMDRWEAEQAFFRACDLKLTDRHEEMLLKAMPYASQKKVREDFEMLRREAAEYVEQSTRMTQ